MPPDKAQPSASPSPLDNQPIGYLNGQWVPQSELRVSVSDDGFRYAATAVERLRTYGRKIFQLPAHLRRWRGTLAAIGIEGTPNDAVIEKLVDELLCKNTPTTDRLGDIGVVIVATPGFGNESPTLAIHLNIIDHRLVIDRHRYGQPLVVTDVVQPSPMSWPRGIKVRCRLHYYLADQIARQSHAGASGVLLDEDGSITETSISNIAIVKDGEIVSPPKDRVLGGITQSVTERIAKQHSMRWTKRAVSVLELVSADEVLLMGTDSGIWFACSVDGETKMANPSGSVYSVLRSGFDRFTDQEK